MFISSLLQSLLLWGNFYAFSGSLCQSNSKLRYPVGANVQSFAEAKGTDTITITYSPMTKDGFSRQGVITLQCDYSKYPGEFITPFTQEQKGDIIQYRATFASKCVCDDGCSPTPAGNHGWKLKGPSTGSILLIVVIQLAFIYCINGTLYNEYKEGYGSFPEMIPNHSFWIELPSLIKEGCAFTFHSLASCCSSLLMRLKGETYAKILSP
ncbi:cation-dependent mannose-6-phosphate receptor-like isoform X2 [Acropora palmata]|uniref:cation-dependent mannose-6-phosphate receptor-like isoform X2 n=1 Tax=Acropora palmata TaxID=6131 RepID=UPI003DA1A45A